MTRTELAIGRLRQWIVDCMVEDCDHCGDIGTLLAEYDRIKRELDRLTTSQNSEHIDGEQVLIWRDGKPFCIQRTTLPNEQWTPLPEPKEAPSEPQK